MTRIVNLAADRVAPWRGADWRVLIAEGILLVLGGVYLLIDGQRAEFVLGLVVGLRQWYHGFRRLSRGRPRDLTLIRGSVGIVVGIVVIGLSISQQITVVGIRSTLGVGGLAYGLLGLAIATPTIRQRQASWTSVGFDVLLVAVGLLLLYLVATSASISVLLAVIGWLVVGAGLGAVAVGLIRRPPPLRTEGPDLPSNE